MTVGYQIAALDVHNRSGGLVVALWKALDDVHDHYLWLTDGAHSDSFLNGLSGGGITGSATTGDVKLLRDSFADLGGASGLWAVAHGTFAPGGNSNFFANAKNLTGVTYAA